jgi:hypothetical protein
MLSGKGAAVRAIFGLMLWVRDPPVFLENAEKMLSLRSNNIGREGVRKGTESKDRRSM